MDYQTQIDNLIELAIVQRDELKQLVEQLPQLREYLSAEVEKKIEAIEPELRQELEEFFARKTEERVDVLRGDVSERVAEMLKSLEMAAAAKYSALMNERARNAELLSQAEQKIADAAATIPSKVKDIVLDELSRFPRANQIDQLRKEFAEPRGFNPRGKWQTGERYQKLDLVSYNGDSYVSNVDDNTEKPSRFSASWTLSAARGQGGGGGPSSLNDLTQPPSNGTLLIGSGTSWVNGNIIGGTGVTVTNQPGSILIDATGAQEILTATVKNAESVAITKGQVVYLFGATGNMASVKLASNTSDATSAKTFGVVSSTSISAGGTGTVTCVGVLDGLNLGTYNEGDTVYLGATPGTFTATKPYAPNHLVYVGIVERANAGNGELYVKIQNGYELDEIHDVQINAPKLAGQTLLYDATTDLWKNARLTGTANQITVTNADAAVTLSIPTNPTLPGNVTVTGKITAQGTTAFPYDGQIIAQNSSPSGTNTALSQAIFGAQPGYSTFVGTTGDGTAASYRTGGLGAVILDQQGYVISDAARGLLLHSINGPTIFATQNTGSEKMRLQSNGTLLLKGDAVDSSNGRLQLADHTASTGGIGMGTDWSFFRLNTSVLRFQTASASPGLSLRHSSSGTELTLTASTASGNGIVNTVSCNNLVLGVNGGTALTLDVVQNATFAKDIFLGTSGPSVPSTLSGRAPRQGLVFAGTTDATLSGPTMGTQCTIAFTVRLSSLAAQTPLVFFSGTGFIGTRITSGALFWSAAASDFSSIIVAGKTTHVVVVANGTTATPYIDGVAGTAIAFTSSVGGITNLSYAGNATLQMSGLVAYNRALSAAEVKALYENGVPAASDINSASNTSIITGDDSTFASNTGWWTLSGSATISGGSLNLSAGGSFAWRNGLLRPGSRYLVTVNITANTAVDGLAIYSGGAIVAVFTGTGTKTAEFAAGSSAPLGSFYLFQAGAGAITVDSVTLNALGAVLAPDAAQTGGGLTWYDTSGNGANITLPASGVSWNVPWSGSLTPSGAATPVLIKKTQAYLEVNSDDIRRGRFGTDGSNSVSIGSLTNHPLEFFVNSASAGRFAATSGNLLLGTTTDSSNGRLQLATHTASTGGIGFGTDTSLYRQAVGMLQLDHVGGSNPQFKIATSGTTRGYLRADVNGNLVVNSTGTGSVYLAFDNGTGGVVFGNGAVGAVGGVTSAGNASFNGTLSTGNNVTIRRDQAGNTSQFIDNRDTTGGEVLWFTEDGLSTEYAYIARYNSLHPTTAKRKALEFGVNGVGAYYSFAAGDVKMTGNAYSSGTRGFSRYKSANGTTASPVEDRIVGFSNTNDLLFNVGMFAANSLTDNSSVWLRFKALDSIGNPQIGLTVTADTVTLSPTGSGQAIISNNSGAGTATRLTIAQTGIRLWYIENTATTGNLTFGDGAGEVLRIIGSGAGTFLFGTTTNSSNGRLQLATHTAATGGIGFGTDTALYRANAGQLYLDAPASTSGAFWVNAGAGNTSASLNLYPQGTGVAQVSAVGAASLVLRTNNATALSLDSSQNANLAGSYFFIGGAGSNFYIRSTGADNGLIRGNNLSVDCASDFLFRNGNGTTEYARVVGSSGTFLLGTSTNSSNGRLQLATHTAYTGGIGFGTETSLYRYQAGGLAVDHTNGTAPALMWRETGTSTLRIETNSQVAYISTLTANSLILRTNATIALTLDSSQNATFAGTIRTAAPVGGTAASWKLGTVATVSPTSPNRTIEVDIGGTIYYIHAKTTNN